jgi:hypothetical protein
MMEQLLKSLKEISRQPGHRDSQSNNSCGIGILPAFEVNFWRCLM